MKRKKMLGIVLSLILAMTMTIPMTAFGDEAGGDQNNDDPPVSTEKAQQTISFGGNISVGGINTIVYGETIDLEAQAAGDISYATSDDSEEVIVLDQEKGTVEGVGTGTATVTVKAGETEEYNETTQELSFQVVKADQKISFDKTIEEELKANHNVLSIEYGETRTLEATPDSGEAITFSYDSPNNRIKIDKNGNTLTISTSDEQETETAAVTVVAPSTENYNSTERRFEVVTVDGYDGTSIDAVAGFHARPTTLYRLFDGETWGEIQCGEPVDILSDVIDRVLAKTINIWSGYKYVKEPQSVTVAQQQLTMVPGSTAKIDAAAETELTYTSSDEGTVSVDENGMLTAKGVGEASVTVGAKETRWFKEAAPVTIDIAVVEQGQSEIALESETVTKSIGEGAFHIGAKLTAGDGTLKYSSDNKKVATIDASGNVKILKPGTATFTVSVAETQFYQGAKKTVALTVKTLAKPSLTVKAIGNKKIKLTWSAIKGASKYQIYTYVNKKKKTLTGNAVPDDPTLKTITNTKLKKGKEYKYKIRAMVKVNGITYYGPWSKVQKAKCK